VVEEIGGGDKVEWMRLRNVQTGEQWQQSVGGVFIYVGFEPNSGFFRDPVEKEPLGFVITDDKMETSIPGIFCAGDVRAQYVRQITNAVGDATTAAIAATRYIEALDHHPKADLAEIERETEAALKAGAAQYP
jgi:thioredoxin reductase (NADPH)